MYFFFVPLVYLLTHAIVQVLRKKIAKKITRTLGGAKCNLTQLSVQLMVVYVSLGTKFSIGAR
jgi:hypothetical protein